MLRQRPRIFTYGKELYHPLFSRSSCIEKIKSAINQADATWILVGIATSVPDISQWSAKVELLDEKIAMLAERAEQIIIGALGIPYLEQNRTAGG